VGRTRILIFGIVALACGGCGSSTSGGRSTGADGSATSTSSTTTSTTSTTTTTTSTTTTTTTSPSGTHDVDYEPFTTQGTIDPQLQIVARLSATTCFSGGVAGGSSYRCFTQPSAIYDPCFARPGATSGPLLCPVSPDRPQVTELSLSPLPPQAQQGVAEERPWAVQLTDGQVCVLVNAAWGGFGPLGCQPSVPRPLADCHMPVQGQGTPWWTVACQAKEAASSPFLLYRVDTLWT
jgi:hypothetical protein